MFLTAGSKELAVGMKGEHEEQKKENNLKDVSKIKQSLGNE